MVFRNTFPYLSSGSCRFLLATVQKSTLWTTLARLHSTLSSTLRLLTMRGSVQLHVSPAPLFHKSQFLRIEKRLSEVLWERHCSWLDADATDEVKATCEKKLKELGQELGNLVSKFIIRQTNDLLSKYCTLPYLKCFSMSIYSVAVRNLILCQVHLVLCFLCPCADHDSTWVSWHCFHMCHKVSPSF